MNKTQDQSQETPDNAQSTPGNVLPFAESQHRSPAGSHPEATPPRTCPFVRMLYRTAADMRRSSPCCSSGQENRKFPSAHKPQSSVHIVFALLTTWWLTTQTQYERSIEVYERSGISDSPGLMNNMGYSYAYLRQFDKAFAQMDKYVGALPQDANPQDSYAEILRMAGRFQESIEHYRAALAINPEFYSSQFGIADTYSLMGDQTQARKEYEAGFRKFSLPELHKILWQTREATTYVREGDYQEADRAFHAIVEYTHSKNMSQVEADTYRQMAMYQQNTKQ